MRSGNKKLGAAAQNLIRGWIGRTMEGFLNGIWRILKRVHSFNRLHEKKVRRSLGTYGTTTLLTQLVAAGLVDGKTYLEPAYALGSGGSPLMFSPMLSPLASKPSRRSRTIHNGSKIHIRCQFLKPREWPGEIICRTVLFV